LTLTVEVEDRHLAVEDSGAPAGFPVFLMHGTPGSRLGPQPRSAMLHRRGIRLISYDRPGYGESTRKKDRCVADAAHDVRVIADRLGLPLVHELIYVFGQVEEQTCHRGVRVVLLVARHALGVCVAEEEHWFGRARVVTDEFGHAGPLTSPLATEPSLQG
jgi:hypothetical protein